MQSNCAEVQITEISSIKLLHQVSIIKSTLLQRMLDTKIIGELSKDIRVHSITIAPEYRQSQKYAMIADLFKNVKTNQTSWEILRAVTREASPEGIIAEIGIPTVLDENTMNNGSMANERILFLFRISDPGNLGTLMRTALAFEWDRIVLVDDCVDPFNPECIKSSMGAALKLNVHRIKSDVMGSLIERNNITTMIADSNSDSYQNEYDNKTNQNLGLVLGSEANGFSGFPKELYEKLIKISLKMSDKVESLNVAISGGILMNKFYNS